MGRAVAKRKAEFLSGRFLAAVALQHVVGGWHTIGIGEHRQPLWPAKVSGSISHASNEAACLVSGHPAACVGVDIENVLPEHTAVNIAGSVICDSERALLSECSEPFAVCLTAVFSAKETIFKALYPKVGYYFDFDAALVTHIDLSRGIIAIELTRDLGAVHHAGDHFEVRLMLESGRVLSYLVTALDK
jgi:4'-phosphopantetheinyl transferase EntD